MTNKKARKGCLTGVIAIQLLIVRAKLWWLQQPVWVDAEGLPYGTIRIKAGERIAQMVVTSFRRAEFDQEADPNATGHNRGGGFGSTGIDTTTP